MTDRLGRISDEVNRRLAERLSAAGVSESQVAQAVLFLLPREFVDAYEALYHRALRVAGDHGKGARIEVEVTDGRGEGTGEYETYDGVGRASGGRVSRLKEGATLGEMGGAKKARAHKKAWVIADEIALEMKVRLDKRLRRMAREMRALTEGSGAESLAGGADRKKCAGRRCGKWLELGWKYCPSCGARQRSGSSGGEEEGT